MINNDSAINSVYAFRDGTLVQTGDALGSLKIWDVRTNGLVATVQNDALRHPISHLLASAPGTRDGSEGRYLAVNS